jgi:macrolide-specific efflux system membrane fusion protein
MRRAILLAALAVAGCGSKEEAAAAPRAKAVRRELTSTVRATGAVRPQVGAEVRVGSRISGRVVRLHANLKDSVRKGQVLAELEREELDAAAAQRRAEAALAEARLSSLERLFPRELEKAEAEVARWRASEALAKKELGRQDDLLRQEFVSQQSRDQAEERLLAGRAQLDAAVKSRALLVARNEEDRRQGRAELERARAALAAAEVQLSYAEIRAPISGVIGSVSTQEGETVAAGLSAPTFVTIVDLARLQVDAFVDEVDIGKVKVDQKASFGVDAFPSREFEGRVVAIYPKPVVIDNVVKYVVALEISTAYEGFLRPDMTANVAVRIESRRGLAVPSRAVKRDQGMNVVWVMTAQGAEARPVRVGWKDGPWVEIVGGLEEGQEVLLEAPAPAEQGGGRG